MGQKNFLIFRTSGERLIKFIVAWKANRIAPSVNEGPKATNKLKAGKFNAQGTKGLFTGSVVVHESIIPYLRCSCTPDKKMVTKP
jgi:hypothetical protein